MRTLRTRVAEIAKKQVVDNYRPDIYILIESHFNITV